MEMETVTATILAVVVSGIDAIEMVGDALAAWFYGLAPHWQSLIQIIIGLWLASIILGLIKKCIKIVLDLFHLFVPKRSSDDSHRDGGFGRLNRI